MSKNEPLGPAYTLVTYRAPKGAAAGAVRNGTVFSAAELTGNPAHATMLGILSDWEAAAPMLAKIVAVADKSRGTPIETAQLLAPVLYPSAIFCAGANLF